MTHDKHECDLMCERFAAYVEGDLSAAEQTRAERHLAECATCAQTLVELRAIAGEAAQLPLLTPSRDLWTGIASRISTPVTPLESAPATVRRAPRREWQYAIAAAALIAVTAGVTYMATARPGATASTVARVAAATPAQTRDSVTAPATGGQTVPAAPGGRLVTDKKEMSATRVYDGEIALLDSLVKTRRESLDPKTVKVIEHNLQIIDRAIAESRAALAKDPKSPLLTNRLDNVLGSKVELLRTVAFLPTQS